MRLCLLLLLFLAGQVQAQKEYLITGMITDSLSGEPIPFATVTLKKSLIGTVSSENGKFELHVPDSVRDDALLITLLGYAPREFVTSALTGPLQIRLVPSVINLNEVPVTPQPPTYYIKLALNSRRENYPTVPFESGSYYREIIKENDNFLRAYEGFFKTYYPNMLDSAKNQHQLMLFRKVSEMSELMFMKKERMRKAAKEERKEARAIAKGKAPAKAKKNDDDTLKIGEEFGGPDNLLQLTDFVRKPEAFFDTSEFKNYEYEFAPATSFNNATLMVIRFKSKGKVDGRKEQGLIYLDIATNAIVRVENAGTFIIPAILRPVLLVAGYGVTNPKFKTSTVFQQIGSKWYPNTMRFDLDINVERKRMFSANDNSRFTIQGILNVNRLVTGNPVPVEKTRRYKSRKRPEEQVFNDYNLRWEEVNVLGL